MAVVETHRSNAFGYHFAGRIASNVTHIANDVARWNDTRVTRKALGKLSDRQLDDIGLCRGDIFAIK